MGTGKSKDAVRSALDDAWIADGDRACCFHCLTPFTIAKRRHHCRSCGELFCKNCWGKKMNLPPALFPSLTNDARQEQPTCNACLAILSSASSGGAAAALWQGGVVVHVAEASLKVHGRPVPLLVPPLTERIRSGGPSQLDVTPTRAPGLRTRHAPRFVLRLERWRPFNRVTCLAVDQVAEDESPRRARTHSHIQTSRSRFQADSGPRPGVAMPESLGRYGGVGRPRGFVKAMTQLNSDSAIATVTPSILSNEDRPSAVAFRPEPSEPRLNRATQATLRVANDSVHPDTPRVDALTGGEVSETRLSSSAPQRRSQLFRMEPSESLLKPDMSLAAPLSATSPASTTATDGSPVVASGGSASPVPNASDCLPERWETALGDLISVTLLPLAASPHTFGIRCETKTDIVVYAIAPSPDIADTEQAAAAVEAAITSIVRVARQRSVVRVSEPTATNSGGYKTFAKERR